MSLGCLTHKVGTNGIKQTLSILHHQELSCKKLGDPLPDMNICQVVLEHLVQRCKKRLMYHSTVLNVLLSEIKLGSSTRLPCIPNVWNIWKNLCQKVSQDNFYCRIRIFMKISYRIYLSLKIPFNSMELTYSTTIWESLILEKLRINFCEVKLNTNSFSIVRPPNSASVRSHSTQLLQSAKEA